MFQETFKPLEIDEVSLAFGAHQEVGPGGHFLGAARALVRFRECFYRPHSTRRSPRTDAEVRRRRAELGDPDPEVTSTTVTGPNPRQ